MSEGRLAQIAEQVMVTHPTAVRVVIVGDQVHAHVSVTLAAERHAQALAQGQPSTQLYINHALYTSHGGPVGWGVLGDPAPAGGPVQLDLFGVAA